MWDPTCAQVGAQWSCWAEVAPKSIQMVSRLKSCDAHVGPSHVQHGVTWDLLATASHQVGPNGDTICGTLLGTKCHRYEKNVEDTSENASFDDFVLGRKCPPC